MSDKLTVMVIVLSLDLRARFVARIAAVASVVNVNSLSNALYALINLASLFITVYY